MGLYLRLLGPPQLLSEGQPVAQLPRKAVVIAAYLLSQQAGVERSRIADLLWEGEEEAVRRNLRQELFRLKGTPWEGVFVQTGQHLALAPLQTDLEQFLAHMAAGAWAEAVVLWRGGFLQGLDPKSSEALWDWLIPERERWERLYHEAMLGQARSLEAQGQYLEAIKVYQAVLDQDPLQETEQQALIRLLALRGDRTAALRQFEQYRNLLQQNLGLEPSPETLALFERLKSGKGVQGGEGYTPKVLSEPPLVGRSKDWAWLETHWGQGMLLLGAEAGVGKSRLAMEFAQRRGQVLRIFQHESSTGVGFGGILEVLRQGLEAGKLEALEPVWRSELSQLLPELNRRTAKREPGSTNKARLFEAIGRALQLQVHKGGVLVWEDLHWLDWASLEFLPYFARRAASLGLFLLGTARSDSLNQSPPVLQMLRELGREGKLFEHQLKPLDTAALVQLMRGMSGQQGGSELFSERLFAATDGNVFFVLETLRYLFEQGLLRAEDGIWRTPFDDFTTDYRELPLPPSVRATLLGRLERLGEGALAMVQAVALADLPIRAEVAAILSEDLAMPIGDLEALVSGGFLRHDDGGYTLRHELTRQAVLAEMTDPRKRWMHARIAAALQAAGGPLPQLAMHLEAAGQLSKAYEAHLQAGRSLRHGPLARQALEHYSKAQTLLPPLASDPERFRLLMEAAETRVSLGQTRFSERHQLQRLAAEMGSSERFRLRLLDADASLASGQVGEGIVAAREALELAETVAQRGHALFKIAWLEYRGGDPDAQLYPLLQALQAFHDTGDQSMQALALRNLAGYWFRLGDLDKHDQYFAQAWTVAHALDDTFLIRRLKADKANVDWVKGDYHSSQQLAQLLYVEARERGDGWAVWDALQALLHNAAILGLEPELEQEVRAAIAEAAEVGAWRDLALLRSDYGAALLTENRLQEAKTELTSALRDLREMGERANIGHTLFFLGYTLLELGDSKQSQALLEEAANLWASRKEYRHQARALAALALARMRLLDDAGALEASALALKLHAPWAIGIYDLPLVTYARARTLGDVEGRDLLIKAQQSLGQIAQALPPEWRKNFEANRFVVWAMSKKP